MDVNVRLITPDMAKEWIATSGGNPRWTSGKKLVDNRVVSRIANDIKNGKWNPGNNSIAFDENGVLVDGHHRLMAIVESGIPVTSIVVFGVKKDGLPHIDENRSRTVYQRTNIPASISAAANCHSCFLNGCKYYQNSTEAVIQFIQDHPFINDAYKIAMIGASHTISLKGGFVHAVMLSLEYGESRTVLERFSKCVNSGFLASDDESAAIVLRNTIMSNKYIGSGRLVHLSTETQNAIFDFVSGTSRRFYRNPSPIYFNKLYSEVRNA